MANEKPMQNDPILGGVNAVPEPFWVRSWRTLWRWSPACYECRAEKPGRAVQHDAMRFRNRDEWAEHYLRTHA